MHINEINDALARRDMAVIEHAFRILVTWPGEENIENSTDKQRKDVLEHVCEALKGDTNAMSGHPLDVLQEECRDVTVNTYAQGAEAVLGHLIQFTSPLDRDHN